MRIVPPCNSTRDLAMASLSSRQMRWHAAHDRSITADAIPAVVDSRENQQTVVPQFAHRTHLPRSQAMHSRFTNMTTGLGTGDFTPIGRA
jgi:hypothetical protein